MIPMILLAFGLQVAAATPQAAQPPKPAGTTVVTPTPPRIEPPVFVDDDKKPIGPNVRVELTLSDLGGNGTAATTKTVTITTNDGKFGKLRTQVTSRAYGGAPLNVDVQPFVRSGGQILLHLTIEYSQGRNPDADGNPDRIMSVSLNQSAVLLLENGKPLMLSQSADPIGDRKVTVEVKATVLKN
jgi:hypothetical protein